MVDIIQWVVMAAFFVAFIIIVVNLGAALDDIERLRSDIKDIKYEQKFNTQTVSKHGQALRSYDYQLNTLEKLLKYLGLQIVDYPAETKVEPIKPLE